MSSTSLPNKTDGDTALRLRMAGVRKTFGPTVALNRIDLEIAPGEVHALIGENGAGKSTLMKVLSGAHDPDAGQMWVDGEPYRPTDPAHGRAAGVAMIYQELSLAQNLTLGENIMLGIEPKRAMFLNRRVIHDRSAAALERVGLGHLPVNTIVGKLSNAEQQLVEIARSLVLDCRVLVLDEPTSSLTAKDIEKLFSLIQDLKAQGISIIYISHFLEEITAISDRFTVLRDGNTVGHGQTAQATHDEIIAMMVGRDVEDLYPRSDRQPGDVVLKLDALAGAGGKPANATLELRRGEVLGIAGLVAAGRTEMMRAIFGLDSIASGTLTVGAYAGAHSPFRRWRQGVGMLSEDRKHEGLALDLSIADNTTMSNLKCLGPLGMVFPLRQARACQPWIERIPIKCSSAYAKVSSLSGGNQQKVALARLLHADVDVLLLDEPTRGIDVGSKSQIYQLIDDLTRGDAAKGIAPKAVLMISSYLPELLGVCDRIQVMCRGVLHPPHLAADFDEHELMREAIGAA